jgi:uncharacterized protein YjbI with pentapeptide repeats
VADDGFTLEGRTYYQRRQGLTDSDSGNSTPTDQTQQFHWYSRDLITAEEQHIGRELAPEINVARVTRDMLVPYISATRTRLKEIEQALGRLDVGDPLTAADRVSIAACGFGTALVGGCPTEIYKQGEQLAMDILRGVDPSEPRATGAYLRGADLSGARLAGSDLSSADLRHARLRGTDLADANLNEAQLVGADLSGANLTGARLNGANLQGANLREADLTRADLGWADLREVDLRRANLYEADLSGADLGDTNLRHANMQRATLRLASLRRADLHFANLTEVRLHAADISRANLVNADLSRAELRDAILSRTNLEGATIAAEQLAQVQYLRDIILPDGSNYSVVPPNSKGPAAGKWL